MSRCINEVKTNNRIVLTGYPVQNNLLEYWCMVDFVRPAYLRTQNEFQALFETPILFGQCVESTSSESQLMRYRLHVLQLKLEKCVQRRSHILLEPHLHEKYEYVLLLKMTAQQTKMYTNLIGAIHNPLEFFSTSLKIFNHPDILFQYLNEKHKKNLNIEWSSDLFHTYSTNQIENSIKMQMFFCILDESIQMGDRVLLFSHILDTLDILETFLKLNSACKWIKNFNYYRLDGSTSTSERQKLINGFNNNENVKLFLIYTKAGSLGTNLTGANRVVLFDISWNPCHDAQAVCRVYRFGQEKRCITYRLITDCSIEKKVFDRQINKQIMALNVVDKNNTLPYISKLDLTNILKHCNKDESIDKIDIKAEKYLDTVIRKVIEKLLVNSCRKSRSNMTLFSLRMKKLNYLIR